jgi:hypothetical protein
MSEVPTADAWAENSGFARPQLEALLGYPNRFARLLVCVRLQTLQLSPTPSLMKDELF